MRCMVWASASALRYRMGETKMYGVEQSPTPTYQY